MAFKFVLIAVLVAFVRGGFTGPVAAIASHPATSYAYAGPSVQLTYAGAPAPKIAAYATPIAKVAAFPAPVAYAAPVAYPAHAPVAKYGAFAAPVAKAVTYAASPVVKTVVDADYDPNPQYSFAYDIQDSLTGDSKNHHETRNGDVVQGSYSLTDADGTRRTVDYTADPVNGFNAVVRKEPLAHAAPVITKAVSPAVVAKVAPAAPVVAKFAAPLSYAAAAPFAYAAPAAKVTYQSPYYQYAH